MAASRCIKSQLSPWRILILGFCVSLFASAEVCADDSAPIEAELVAAALASAGKYASDRKSYVYEPRADVSERAASTVAVTGHLLLEAFLAVHERQFLQKAKSAADSLVAQADMNRDGFVGWGRYWSKSEGTPSRPGDGSNTTFSIDCALERNKAYDDEMYDNARIGHFLLDLYDVTKDPRYLQSARRMVDDTWGIGEKDSNGGFFYYKTAGMCDRGWHVKNVNMLMAIPIALLVRITGEAKYRKRLEAMMKAEQIEVRRTIDGRPAPNLGYYSVQTMRDHPTQGTYVSRAQTTDLTGAISCNPKTSSGESCTAHLGLEARAIDIVLRTSGPDLATVSDIEILMAGHEARDGEMCTTPTTALGRPRSVTYCAAYYCALRHLEARYTGLCLARTRSLGALTPDVVLGLFWGRSGRFEQSTSLHR